MTTPTTPAHAIDLAELIDAGEASAESANAMRSLAQQVEALTAERDGLTQAVIDRDSITRGLLERICALKPDAELYRHLRDHFAKNLENAREEFARLEPLTCAAFDAVVRASMDLMREEA